MTTLCQRQNRRTRELLDRLNDLHRCYPQLDRVELARRLGVNPESLRRTLSRHGLDTMPVALDDQFARHQPDCTCVFHRNPS